MSTSEQLIFVECISIEKRGYIPNRYTVYVLIVEWDNGVKYPIYRKYSSFFDFERMLRQKLGNVGIPELPQMNVLEKAFRRQKNHVNDLNEFCQKIMALPRAILNSHDVVAFFEAWHTDFPMEESDDKAAAKKKEEKKKQNDGKVLRPIENSDLKALDERLANRATPSAPPEDLLTLPLPAQPRSRSASATEDDLMKADVYVCVADYVPDSADELSLQEGWKCVVLEKNSDGWWFIMRERDGHQGYAPGSFLMPEVDKATADTYSEIPSRLNDNNNIEPSCGGMKDKEPLMKVRVLSKHTASNGDELSCSEGEELDVLDMDSNGWWTVRSEGKVGLVPAVHLELSSPATARASEVFLRNNSLYSRNPPPRRQKVPANKNPAGESIFASLDAVVPSITESPGYASIDEINSMMADKRLAPTRMKSDGVLDYAELVFDEQTNKPVFAKSASHNVLGVPKAAPKKQDTIIYTQIVPKNLRKVEEAVEDSSITGKKPERGKALKKQVVPKIEEPSKPKPATRSPSPPTAEGRQSPLPVRPRTPRPQEPLHNYENHSLTAATNGGNGEVKETPTYINVNSLSNSTSQQSDNPDYLRRSSIEPPAPPTVEAPIPSHITENGPSSIESYSPMMSRVQASASYDGPPISGMLMFTKGDTATLMSKTSDVGWWYVNLKGLEGYVPGGYWEAYQGTPPAIAQPRTKAPTPKPRTRSPPIASEKTGLEQEPWYHGKLSRPESEKLLSNFTNGIFLIRESVNRVGDLTLSVRWEGKARHFPIEAKEGGLFYIGKHDFKTLKAVIAHYSKHPLFYSEKNEPVRLKEPASKSSSS